MRQFMEVLANGREAIDLEFKIAYELSIVNSYFKKKNNW